jgi:hypothetical protein
LQKSGKTEVLPVLPPMATLLFEFQNNLYLGQTPFVREPQWPVSNLVKSNPPVV